MKKIYWRPRAISRPALALIALLSIGGLLLVEHWRVLHERPHYKEKLAAAELTQQGMETLYFARLRLGVPVDPSVDPTESGMIGLPMSPVTSISGDLNSKQTTVNPNFAALVVELLKRAGVKEGDAVAVGCSGSFPCLNVATYAALQTLKVKPIIILSASASQWGANVPDLLWIDMERVLHEEGLISFRSVAASVGGYEDRGLGLTDEGLKLVTEAIRRNRIPLIEAADFEHSIDDRMKIYRKQAGRNPIRAYINVGGGTVSVGRSLGKKMFHPGLNLRPPARIRRVDGVMPRFIQEGVPVIHFVEIPALADKYDLPIAPTTMPEVGEGTIFTGREYNKWLAGGVLAVILAALYGFIRSDIGFRLLRTRGRRKTEGHPEPMV